MFWRMNSLTASTWPLALILSRYPCPYVDLSCWGLPKHRKLPLTMIPTREHSASHSAMLWVVRSTDWPAEISPLIIVHRNCRAWGSTPVVGSSWNDQIAITPIQFYAIRKFTNKMRAGRASRAIAVDSFLRFPPEYAFTCLSACSFRPSFSKAHSTTLEISAAGSPRSLQ